MAKYGSPPMPTSACRPIYAPLGRVAVGGVDYRRDARARRAVAEPLAQVLHRLRSSVCNHFDGPVR